MNRTDLGFARTHSPIIYQLRKNKNELAKTATRLKQMLVAYTESQKKVTEWEVQQDS